MAAPIHFALTNEISSSLRNGCFLMSALWVHVRTCGIEFVL
jgi:hypothetical protein